MSHRLTKKAQPATDLRPKSSRLAALIATATLSLLALALVCGSAFAQGQPADSATSPSSPADTGGKPDPKAHKGSVEMGGISVDKDCVHVGSIKVGDCGGGSKDKGPPEHPPTNPPATAPVPDQYGSTSPDAGGGQNPAGDQYPGDTAPKAANPSNDPTMEQCDALYPAGGRPGGTTAPDAPTLPQEKTAPEGTAPENTALDATQPDTTGPAPSRAAVEGSTGQPSSNADPAATPEKTTPGEKTAPEKTAPEKTAPDTTTPQETTAPEATSPEAAQPTEKQCQELRAAKDAPPRGAAPTTPPIEKTAPDEKTSAQPEGTNETTAGMTAPEAKAPPAPPTQPDTTQPSTQDLAPDAKQPDTAGPAPTPQSNDPGTTAPEKTAPDEKTAPEEKTSAQEGTTAPEGTGLGTTGPETTAPETTAAETTGPETTAQKPTESTPTTVPPPKDICPGAKPLQTSKGGPGNQYSAPFDVKGDSFVLSYQATPSDPSDKGGTLVMDLVETKGGTTVQTVRAKGEGREDAPVSAGPGSYTVNVYSDNRDYEVTAYDCTGPAKASGPAPAKGPKTTDQKPAPAGNLGIPGSSPKAAPPVPEPAPKGQAAPPETTSPAPEKAAPGLQPATLAAPQGSAQPRPTALPTRQTEQGVVSVLPETGGEPASFLALAGGVPVLLADSEPMARATLTADLLKPAAILGLLSALILGVVTRLRHKAAGASTPLAGPLHEFARAYRPLHLGLAMTCLAFLPDGIGALGLTSPADIVAFSVAALAVLGLLSLGLRHGSGHPPEEGGASASAGRRG